MKTLRLLEITPSETRDASEGGGYGKTNPKTKTMSTFFPPFPLHTESAALCSLCFLVDYCQANYSSGFLSGCEHM